MKRDLGNFTRGSQLIEHFGFMFAAGLKGPLIISLIVMCWMTWWTVSEGMSDHEVYLAWMHVYGVGYRFMEFDPAHDVTVRTAWGRAVTFPISLLDIYPPVVRAWHHLLKLVGMALAWSTVILVPVFVAWVWFASRFGGKAKERQHERGAKLTSLRDLETRIRRHNKAEQRKEWSAKLGNEWRFCSAAKLARAFPYRPSSIAGVTYPWRLEQSHAMLIGTTGMGKTVALSDMIEEARERGHRAVIFDLTGHFIEHFYDASRDVILNPLDARCPRWSVFDECRDEAEFTAAAEALVPHDGGGSEQFWVLAARLRYGITLNAGQEAAGRLLLGSTNRIVAIQGVAGAGKSTVLKPVADILREEGRVVLGLAVQNTLVQMLERDTGIPSMTVARFLRRHQDLLKGGDPARLAEARADMKGAVILLDEASMVGNADKEKLVLLANLLGVDRFASIGDSKQLGAVDAGKPFDVMQRSGAETATMNTNIRARTKSLSAAQQAAQGGRIDDALRHLGKNVVEVGEGAAIEAAAAWLSLAPVERERTAIYASGRALRSEVNAAVQTGLKANGELGQTALRLDVLSRVDTTREELRYASSYRPGMVAVFDRDNRAQKLGKGTYTVIESDRQRGSVTLEGEGGKHTVLKVDRLRPNGDYDPLRLFEVKRLELHAGDRIRWTETDHRRGLINADQARITAIGRETVSLVTSMGIAHDLPASDPMLKRLDLAYALNAHMAQGLTSDRGIAVMDSRERNLSNQQTFLVTVTRLRDGLTLFVNDASRLGAAIARNTGMKRSALETVGLLREAAASGLARGKSEAALQSEPPVLKEPPEREKAMVKPFEMGI